MAKKSSLPKLNSINLISVEQVMKEEPIGKFLEWANNAGRIIVVLVEAVVLIVFFARFKVDSQILDLKQEMTAKAQLLQSLQNFEHQFTNLQQTIQSTTDLQRQAYQPDSDLLMIEKNIPKDVFLTTEEVSSAKILLRGTSESYNSVTAFWQGMKKDFAKRQKKVNLVNLGRETNQKTDEQKASPSSINFVIEIKNKPKPTPSLAPIEEGAVKTP